MELKQFVGEVIAPAEGVIEGYASKFNVVDMVNDRVMPGAFRATLMDRGPRRPVLAEHDRARSIGVGELYEDGVGLRMRAQLELGLHDGRETYLRVKAGIVSGLSIGYETVRSRMVRGVRELTELKLHEVSCVVMPALVAAQIDSVKGNRQALTEIIEALRGAKLAAAPDDDVKKLRDAISRVHAEGLARFDALRLLRGLRAIRK